MTRISCGRGDAAWPRRAVPWRVLAAWRSDRLEPAWWRTRDRQSCGRSTSVPMAGDREARDSRPRRRARELCHSCPPCARAYVLRVNGYERREQWGEGEEEGGLGEARVAASTPSLRRPASLLGCSCPFSPLARFKGRRLPGRRVGLTDEGAGKKGPELEGSGSTARFPPRRKWRGAARRAGREERCPYDLNLTMGAMYG